jgi:CubicO group peptidase (beta-lactamase class C family)
MVPNRFARSVITFALVLATSAPSFAATQAAKTKPAPSAQATGAVAQGLDARLAAIEKAIDDKRKEYGIPGVSLVVVKDDAVIYMKGLGVKDFEKKLPVTPDTLFAIGSATKAFTAMTLAQQADEGKVSFDDSPKKFLPYFKLYDPEANANITIRDLLCHRSGLGRTDLAMVTGKLGAEELIRVAGEAKPVGKFREKFGYQNIMFSAAGLVSATIDKKTWDQVIAARILKPLGMNSTTTTVQGMERARDHSFGYDYNFDTKETRKLPYRPIAESAPAGAINSNARDMAQWLRLMLGGGVFNGKRLVSEKNFNELVTKQMTIGGNVGYGFGWMLNAWKGHKIVEHGGNIDGFATQVALMPDQKLGFVILANVTYTPLTNEAMSIVWSNLVDVPAETATAPAATPAGSPSETAEPATEAGSYLLAQANVTIDITFTDGKLVANVPGQQPYPLTNVGGRRYKLDQPAPDGFFMTFRKAEGTGTEMFLEQPQGNATLKKVEAVAKAADSANAGYGGPLKELIGSYHSNQQNLTVEITVREGSVALIVPGQPAYPLVEKEKDLLMTPNLPETYSMLVKRDGAGAVSGVVIRQPEGSVELARVGEPVKHSMTAEQVMTAAVEASGGESNLRRHRSIVQAISLDFENQGVKAKGTVSAMVPNMTSSDVEFFALGKSIGWARDYFDGAAGGSATSFSPPEALAGTRLDEAKTLSDFHGLMNWKTMFKKVELRDTAKVGDEDAYVVVMTPERGNPVTIYVSTKSYLVLRRDTLQTSSTSNIKLPLTELYSDYRTVDGLVIPFKALQKTATMGDVAVVVTDVKLDVDIPATEFKPR